VDPLLLTGDDFTLSAGAVAAIAPWTSWLECGAEAPDRKNMEKHRSKIRNGIQVTQNKGD